MTASFTSAEFKTRRSTKPLYSGLFYPEAHALTSNTCAYTHIQALLCHSLSHTSCQNVLSSHVSFRLAVERRKPCIPSCRCDPDHKLMFSALERLKSSEAKKHKLFIKFRSRLSLFCSALHASLFPISYIFPPSLAFYPSGRAPLERGGPCNCPHKLCECQGEERN